ncbi:sensory neuron membrane protein 2 [Lasius niger]|uniref:Sensory neuron membrane protein 2 n=1 Tax=Lasius niger TaxID=67767 RepID=A0A0J7MP75_LASNI|nr:sensory neuron membrane protein 2 [Lasius niger]
MCSAADFSDSEYEASEDDEVSDQGSVANSTLQTAENATKETIRRSTRERKPVIREDFFTYLAADMIQMILRPSKKQSEDQTKWIGQKPCARSHSEKKRHGHLLIYRKEERP